MWEGLDCILYRIMKPKYCDEIYFVTNERVQLVATNSRPTLISANSNNASELSDDGIRLS